MCVYAVSHFFSCCRMALQKSGRSVGVREVIYLCRGGGRRGGGGRGEEGKGEGGRGKGGGGMIEG